MHRKQFIKRGLLAVPGLMVLDLAGSCRSEKDYLSLFNGKNLDGWKVPDFEEDSDYEGGKWTVENGAICGMQYPEDLRKGSLLLTEKTFGDFELLIDVLPKWGCDSGIYLRSNQKGQSIQVMVDYLDKGTVGYIFGQGTGGYLSRPVILVQDQQSGKIKAVDAYDGAEKDGLNYSANAAEWERAWNFDDWNTLKIRCEGKYPDITTWINGTKISEMRSSSFHPRKLQDTNNGNWNAPTAYKPDEVYQMIGAEGSIGLQVHPFERWAKGEKVRYKNIKIRQL